MMKKPIALLLVGNLIFAVSPIAGADTPCLKFSNIKNIYEVLSKVDPPSPNSLNGSTSNFHFTCGRFLETKGSNDSVFNPGDIDVNSNLKNVSSANPENLKFLKYISDTSGTSTFQKQGNSPAKLYAPNSSLNIENVDLTKGVSFATIVSGRELGLYKSLTSLNGAQNADNANNKNAGQLLAFTLGLYGIIFSQDGSHFSLCMKSDEIMKSNLLNQDDVVKEGFVDMASDDNFKYLTNEVNGRLSTIYDKEHTGNILIAIANDPKFLNQNHKSAAATVLMSVATLARVLLMERAPAVALAMPPVLTSSANCPGRSVLIEMARSPQKVISEKAQKNLDDCVSAYKTHKIQESFRQLPGDSAPDS